MASTGLRHIPSAQAVSLNLMHVYLFQFTLFYSVSYMLLCTPYPSLPFVYPVAQPPRQPLDPPYNALCITSHLGEPTQARYVTAKPARARTSAAALQTPLVVGLKTE